MAFESRDPFQIRQEVSDFPFQTQWDRFCRREYARQLRENEDGDEEEEEEDDENDEEEEEQEIEGEQSHQNNEVSPSFVSSYSDDCDDDSNTVSQTIVL